jgi:hypothetical protein
MSYLETAELESDRIDDDAEVLDDDPADPWEGPHTEYDRYGHPTGAAYVRCRDCGIEVVTSTDTDRVKHRDSCRFEDDVVEGAGRA